MRAQPLPGEKNAHGTPKTSQDARQEADTICLAWQHAENLAGAGTPTEIQVRKVLNETLARIGVAPVESPSVRDWLANWILGKTGVVAASTLAACQQIERDFLTWLGHRADAKIETVTPEEITRFRDHLRKEGLTDGTITKLIRKYLNGPFHSAWRLGKIPINPCSFVETKAKTRGAKVRKGVFSGLQVKALVEATAGNWKGVILTAYLTAVRLQDVAHLRRSNLDLAQRTIKFVQRKTGDEVLIPLHSSLESYFLSIEPPKGESSFLFPEVAEQNEGGPNGLSKQFQRLMELAQIENVTIRQAIAGKKGRNLKSLSFHSLRHSFTSELTNAGVPSELRMQLTGHQDDESHAVYTHHDFERLRAAVEKLPKI